MSIQVALDAFGGATVAAAGGFVLGMCFGFCAQRSRFCLRSATIEFWRGAPGEKVAVWLLTFSGAFAATQVLFEWAFLDAGQIRQLTTTGTLSGAIIGGCLFGIGMIMARGCASRLLVLSATGNLRALIAGLVLTVVAQASLVGVLSPLRVYLSGWWLVSPAERDMTQFLPARFGLWFAFACLVIALLLALRARVPPWRTLSALGVGATVAAGWLFTATLAIQSFDLVPVESVSFTGPSANTLMALINTPAMTMEFDIGLVPGVFFGSLLGALVCREFRIQGFDGEIGVSRYVVGASLMGFGGMLAGGCAVGAGVTGGSVMALTAWVALLCMWLSAGVTDLLLDRRTAGTV